MSEVTLEEVNKNVLIVKRELDAVKELLEESQLELSDEAKLHIEESRKRPVSQFRSLEELKKKYS